MRLFFKLLAMALALSVGVTPARAADTDVILDTKAMLTVSVTFENIGAYCGLPKSRQKEVQSARLKAVAFAAKSMSPKEIGAYVQEVTESFDVKKAETPRSAICTPTELKKLPSMANTIVDYQIRELNAASDE